MGALRASRCWPPSLLSDPSASVAPPPGVNSRLLAFGAHMEPLNIFSQERRRCATTCTSRQAFGGLRSRRQVGERYRAGSYRRIRRRAGGTATCLDDMQPGKQPPIGSAGMRWFDEVGRKSRHAMHTGSHQDRIRRGFQMRDRPSVVQGPKNGP